MGTTLKRLGFASYDEYVASPRWQARRRLYYANHPRQCFVCESDEEIYLHHRSYRRLGHEPDSDLVPLCGRCHRLLHDTRAGLDKIVRRMRKAFLDGGEMALKPAVVRPRNMRVLDARSLTAEQRAKYGISP